MTRFAPAAQRVPVPYDIDIEQALLGAILVNNDVYDRVGDFLRPEHFHEPVHQRIYDAIGRTINAGRKAHPHTLANFFSVDPALTELGGSEYLAELTRFSPSVLSAVDFGKSVQDLFMRRGLIEAAEAIAKLASDPPVDMFAVAQIEEAEKIIYALSDKRTASEPKLEMAQTVVHRALASFDHAYQNPTLVGVTTGIAKVDDCLGPLLKSDLIIMAGHTSMGKTALAQQITWHAAHDRGRRCMVETLEMHSEQYVARHIAQIARVPADRLEQGRVSGDEIGRAFAAGEAFRDVPLFINGQTGATTSAIRSRARRLSRAGKLGLITVDHLRFIVPDDPRAPEHEQVQQITRDLKALAKEMDCPVLLVSHLNRNATSRSNKRPIESDLYGGSAIEQNADAICFVYREEYWLRSAEPDLSDAEDYAKWLRACEAAKGKAEVIVTKRRRGQPRTAHIAWDGAMTMFLDPDLTQPEGRLI